MTHHASTTADPFTGSRTTVRSTTWRGFAAPWGHAVPAVVILLAAMAHPAATSAADPPPTADLPPIFNGTDFSGWRLPAEPYWNVVDGAIVGESDAVMKESMLYTEKAYGDVIFETEVRFTGEIDSGIMLRKPQVQVQIGISGSLKRDMTCSFYTGTYSEEARAVRAAELFRPGEWNRIRIEARGDTFTVWLNGEQVSRYRDPKFAAPGPIGLQIHKSRRMRVEFRDLRAMPL